MSYRIDFVMMPFGFGWRPIPIIVPDKPKDRAPNERAKAAREQAMQARLTELGESALRHAAKNTCPLCGRGR